MGILCPSAAFASNDEQQRVWLPSAPAEARGEISYDFDSVLNQTTATYVAPLGKRDLVHRLFATPTVHTIIATYRFNGRIASHAPDTIRVLLESDEYAELDPESPFVLGAARTLNIAVGHRIVEHSISVSQRVELGAQPRGGHENSVFTPDHGRLEQRGQTQLAQAELARVRSKATAWFSICEFLSLIDQREIRGTVAGLDFTLNPAVVAGLNRFASEMLPDDVPRFVDCAEK